MDVGRNKLRLRIGCILDDVCPTVLKQFFLHMETACMRVELLARLRYPRTSFRFSIIPNGISSRKHVIAPANVHNAHVGYTGLTAHSRRSIAHHFAECTVSYFAWCCWPKAETQVTDLSAIVDELLRCVKNSRPIHRHCTILIIMLLIMLLKCES
jgi:hypothetical protein